MQRPIVSATHLGQPCTDVASCLGKPMSHATATEVGHLSLSRVQSAVASCSEGRGAVARLAYRAPRALHLHGACTLVCACCAAGAHDSGTGLSDPCGAMGPQHASGTNPAGCLTSGASALLRKEQAQQARRQRAITPGVWLCTSSGLIGEASLAWMRRFMRAYACPCPHVWILRGFADLVAYAIQ